MLMFRRAIRRSRIRRLVVWFGLFLSVTVLSQAGDAPERSNGERREMATSAAGGVPFTEHVISTAADGARSVFATDVDGDGDTDVLSASITDDKIRWYENDGGSPPTFTARVISAAADGADSVFATDVDGDGDIDVLSASQRDDTIAWYESDGGSPPTFTERVISTAADVAFSVFATDMDGDGDTDVLSASSGDNKIAWYDSDGGSPPTFTERVISTTADGATSVFATDVDGDGDTDVLSASRDDDKIAWYESDGASPPTFTERVISTAADVAFSVFATDVDGDGDTDVLSASSGDNKIAWYDSDGGSPPTFTERVISTTADGAWSVFAIDVDGDGDVDVLSASQSDWKIAWYESDGGSPPTFIERVISTAVIGAHSVFATDVDGDGDIDVLSASLNTGKIAWHENTTPPPPLPTFAERVISTVADGANSVFATDVDGDGDLDVLSSSWGDNTIAWYENDGGSQPAFAERLISTTAAGATSVFAADVDGDGNTDVLSASDGDDTIAWYESDGGSPPSFTERVISTTAVGATSVFAIDLDGDGNTDVLSASSLDDTIAWYESDGGSPPTFTERVISTTADGARSVFATDVDGDGNTDVLSASATDNKIVWYESDGGSPPTFTERIISTVASGAFSVFATDVDGDGDTDVLSASVSDDKIAWYESDGGSPPTFTERVISTTADAARSVFAMDVDGDGDIDVLSASSTDDKIAWYESDGGSPPTFTERVISTIADGALFVFAMDVDGDGDTDILSAAGVGDTIAWYENTTPVCGDDVAEGAEECDGTDDSACPDACLEDCTCDPCGGVTPACTTDADCDDASVCTTETCGGDGCCAYEPIVCDDGDPCTDDSCDSIIGCVNTPVVDGTSCADGDLCNGDETCQLGICTAGSALNCDDSNVCTTDTCDATLGCVNVAVTDGTSCADGTVCNGDETCQLGVCAAGTSLVCDDGNPCTDDSCDSNIGCVNTPSCVCGNDTVEGAEECDGTDDSACPGACLSDCTCVCDAASGANCHVTADDGLVWASDDDIGFLISDDFAPLGTSVTDVCWRGIYHDNTLSPPDSYCGPGTGDDFTITIYNDGGGYPGTVLSSQSVTPSKTDVGPFRVWTAYEYSATLPVPVTVTASTRYWLEIKNNTVVKPTGCNWWWMPDDEGGNAVMAQTFSETPYDAASLRETDRTFCLNTEIAADDGGEILGSCCACPNTCSDISLADCNVAGGTWSVGGMCSQTLCGDHANDACADAIVISEGVTPFSTLCATDDGPATESCELGDTPIGSDIWYQYTAPCDGLLTVSLCDNTFYDATLTIYSDGTGTCACPAVAAPIECNDDGCSSGGPSIVTIEATEGVCYTIRVAGWDTESGSGEIDLSFDPFPPVASGSTRLAGADDTPLRRIGLTGDLATRLGAEIQSTPTGRARVVAGPTSCESTGFEAVEATCSWELGWLCGSTFTSCVSDHDLPADCDVDASVTENCCIDNPNPLNGWYTSITSQHCNEPHVQSGAGVGQGQSLRFQRDADGGALDGPCVGCVSLGNSCRVTAFTPTAGAQLISPTTISFDLAQSAGEMSGNMRYFTVADSETSTIGPSLHFSQYGLFYIYDFVAGTFVYSGYLSGGGAFDHFDIAMDPCNDIVTYTVNDSVVLTHGFVGPFSASSYTVERAIFAHDNGGMTPWDLDNYSVIRADPCPIECGNNNVEVTEECDGTDDAACPEACLADCTCPLPTAQISLKPIDATGVHFITGSNITVVGPGQTITLEVKLSDWGPDLLGGYQADIDSFGYTSGASGLLTPLVMPNAAAGAFIDQARSDFVFFGKSVSHAVDTSSFDYRYLALVQNAGDAVGDFGSSKYGATLKLQMSPDASGTFTVGVDGPDTALVDGQFDTIPIFSLNATTITVLNFSRVYVDENATGADTGESWTDAVRRFQDALTIARDNPSVYEVWVARGTYTPDRGFGFAPGDRSASFELIGGMAFYGGFDGTETLLSQRDPVANLTTLSADLDADDLLGVPFNPVSNCCGAHGGTGCDTPSCEASVCAVAPNCCSTEWDAHCSATAQIVCCTLCGGNTNRCENSYHVVEASDANSDTLLDGFTIVGGLANDPIHSRGGGLHASTGNFTLNRCNFLMNEGLEGGAAYIGSGAPRFLDCTFADGLVTGNGAGVSCLNSSATFRGCTFDGNAGLSTNASGGGLFIFGGASEVVECVFRGNSSGLRGGGLALDDNSASITNCRFVNNAATIGGGISVLGGAATVTNTEFDSNVASSFGGALSVDGTDAQITNCTLSFNSATSGGGVGIAGSSTAGISNSILWRNSDSNGTIESSQIEVVSGSATVAFSTVQGLDTFAGSNNIGTDPQFVDADGADGIPGNADDNLRLAPGSPAIDAGNTTALPSDAFDLDGDLDTAERLPIDLLGNDRLFDDLESVDTGNADPPTYLQVVDMGSYEYFTDCNNNGVVDAVDISMGTSQDCDSPSWPANGKPDECDIADCAGDPACDDCNLTGIPDACDITDGTSADLIGPFGVPDECAQFVDACNPPSDLWTDPCNWDLAGAGPLNLLVGAPSQPNEPPDSEALAMHGYPDNTNGTSDVAVTLNAGDNVFLNESVTIPTLRLRNGAILRLITASGSVTAARPTSGTDLIIEDFTSVGGSVLVGGDGCICVGIPSDEADCSTCVPQGDALIGPGGRYMKDPDVAKESSAILLAINVKLNHEKCDDLDTQEQCEQLSGGVLELTDDMVVVATGDLVLDGALADTPCAEPFGAAIAAVQRFHTPPIKRITGRSRLTVSNNLTLINLATSANASTEGVTVGGDFNNELTDASCFDWTQGKLLLDGTKLQTFEVAARDLGSVADLSEADYVIGTLEVAANSHVTFTDNFVNDPKGSSRDSEALYVETLIVGPNATITLNDVRIYYKNPPIIGEQATIIRKVNGELRSIHDPQPALQPAPDEQGSEVPKNRFISLVIPEPAPTDDPKTAIRVKLITLNRTCSADSNNLFTPCSFDNDCVNGVCQTPLGSGEGQVRYVNVVKTCQGAGAAGTKICRSPADCGEAEECLQMRKCVGTSQLCSDDEDCGEGVACLANMSCPDDTFKPAFLCATTGCEPEYRDWAGDLAGGVLHVYGPGIVPGRSEYDVKQMAASCEGNERCTAVSATLRISTARWADLTANGATNAQDIAAASDKVKPILNAFTKPRTMLIPGVLDPFRNVNVIELQNTIDAVKSLPIPVSISGPQRCP